jgi:hypothetical protein
VTVQAVQLPALQTWFAEQAWPQLPQLVGSVCRLTQPAAQQASPPVHGASPLLVQVHACCLQSGAAGSSHCAFPQQTPLWQAPSQQTAPSPHWLLLVQAVQTLLMQIGVAPLHDPQSRVRPQPSVIWPQSLPAATQDVAVQPQTPVSPPPSHVSGAVQISHAPPRGPQAAFVSPFWQTPLLSQQPGHWLH